MYNMCVQSHSTHTTHTDLYMYTYRCIDTDTYISWNWLCERIAPFSFFFFLKLVSVSSSKRPRLPLYWDFGTALALWATGFQVEHQLTNGKDGRGGSIYNNGDGGVGIGGIILGRMMLIFRSVGSNPHAPIFWTEGRTSSIALQAEAKAGAVNF